MAKALLQSTTPKHYSKALLQGTTPRHYSKALLLIIILVCFLINEGISQNQILSNIYDNHHGSMTRSPSGDIFIATTAYDQGSNSSFIEIIKLNSSDVFQAKVDIYPGIGQNLQVYHMNNGHDGELCLTGRIEIQARSYVYVAIISSSLILLDEAYYEYPNSGASGHPHSQGHYIVPISFPDDDQYLIGGMATDGYNVSGPPNRNEMLDSKRGILLWLKSDLSVLGGAWLNSTYDCDLTLSVPPASPYLSNLTEFDCQNTYPDPIDDYDQIDHIVEYEPNKFLITGSYNTPHFTASGKSFDQASLVYGINLGCGTSNPTALCIGYEFNLSFTTGVNGSVEEDENSVEAIYYPSTDEACVLVNSGQRHGQVIANFNNISLSSRQLLSGIEISSYPMPFRFPIASSMKRADNATLNVPDGVMIGGQFRQVNTTVPPSPPGSYNHSFPFLLHVDRLDPTKSNFLKSYQLHSHDFEAHFPNNMNHLLARGLENAPFTFTPSNLLITNSANSVISKMLMYKIPLGSPLSQLGFLSANSSGFVECMTDYDLNPSLAFLNDTSFNHTSLIEQQMTGFIKHDINSTTESDAPSIENCVGN